MLFEWDMRRESPDRAIAHYYETLYSEESEKQPKPDRFMEELVRGTVEKLTEVDGTIAATSEHWRLNRMAAVDRNILRLAVYEMSQQAVPAAIIIDEALELARQFSNEESLSFINGLLDAVNRQSASTAASTST